MKIDRLIGILSVLLQQECTTAPELAEKFEVSRRTINRDIEDLNRAGIPIQTIQGTGGGIRIMEGYRMDKTLLTSRDMQVIMAGLRSLDSISGSQYYKQLMEKIKPGASHFLTGKDAILIDLSSWYKGAIEPKISMILEAIEAKKRISFDYYASSGEGRRNMEPYYLIFKWSSWYAYGWCEQKKDFRLFKLNRMNKIQITQWEFTPRAVPLPELDINKIYPEEISVEAVFAPDVKWRVVEEYGPDCFTIQEDGSLYFRGKYTDFNSLVTWMLTFGDRVRVVKPTELKEALLQQAKEIVKKYEEE